jgi:hypothetical protein
MNESTAATAGIKESASLKVSPAKFRKYPLMQGPVPPQVFLKLSHILVLFNIHRISLA